MDSKGDINSRHIVPRWRPVAISILLGEAKPALARGNDVDLSQDSVHLERAKREFEENRLLPFAAEILTQATAVGDLDAAREVAIFIDRQDSVPILVRNIVDTILGRRAATARRTESPGDDIRMFRKSVTDQLRDPLSWLDVGLAYTSLGMHKKALRALKVARSHAPENRLILRASARLFQHLGDHDKALHVLERDPALLAQDPWLLAPSIAIRELVGASPRNIRASRRLAENENYSPFHLAELSAAMGSLELDNGSRRKAKRLFRRALVQPTEVSVAHAVWASQNYENVIDIPDDTLILKSHEAQALEAFADDRWFEARDASIKWLEDEPFATRPAMFVSSLSTAFLNDHTRAIDVAEAGLRANPGNIILKNNLVFAKASIGKISEATDIINLIPKSAFETTPTNLTILTATTGFVAFRSGDSEAGSTLYQRAIDLAEKSKDFNLQAKAAIFLAREARIAGLPETDEHMRRAKELTEKSTDTETKALYEVHIDGKQVEKTRGFKGL